MTQGQGLPLHPEARGPTLGGGRGSALECPEMTFLHEPGDLVRTPLAAILLEALNLRATGVLTVQHGGGSSRLFIKDGRPVGAQVATGIRPLGHMLLQAGAIDIDALSRSLALMAETRRPQGENERSQRAFRGHARG